MIQREICITKEKAIFKQWREPQSWNSFWNRVDDKS